MAKEPCEHILALRLQYARPEDQRVEKSITYTPPAKDSGSVIRTNTVKVDSDQSVQDWFTGLTTKGKSASKKAKASKKPPAKKTTKKVTEDVAEKATKKSSAKKATAKKATKKTTSKKTGSGSLDTLKSLMDYSNLKKGMISKAKLESALESIADYEGKAVYREMIEAMLSDTLIMVTSTRKLLTDALERCGSGGEDQASEEEDNENQGTEIDLNDASVIFVGRFSGFTKTALNRAAKEAGASVAKSISGATLVIKGSSVGSKQQQQLKSFDGEIIDIDAWTERIGE